MKKTIAFLVFSAGIIASSYAQGAQDTLVEEGRVKKRNPVGPIVIANVLERAGENKAELLDALKKVPEKQKKGLEFLIAHMPDKDLKSLKADFLLENVAFAYKARETYPWAKQVPEDIFLNDVLPYASLNERRDNWRKDFHTRFSKYVKDAKTMEEAIKAVNKAIKKEVKVEYNTGRKKPDQSPYESMEINKASCTGLSILLTDAFRSVGIPSRVVGIPAWTTKRGNHNWCEVWIPEKKAWQFTEYDPDEKGLDHGWLLADAAMANPQSVYHSIYASSWKPTGQHFPLVWDMQNKTVPAVNVTERYVKLGGGDKAGAQNLCELRIDYTVDGKRVAIPVAVIQGDVEIEQGLSPASTHDMNRYFTAKVKQGQIYHVVWKAPGQDQWQRRQIKATDKDAFLRIDLGEKVVKPKE